MSGQKTSSGTWVVLALLAIGVIAALVGLKFREMPREERPATARSVSK